MREIAARPEEKRHAGWTDGQMKKAHQGLAADADGAGRRHDALLDQRAHDAGAPEEPRNGARRRRERVTGAVGTEREHTNQHAGP